MISDEFETFGDNQNQNIRSRKYSFYKNPEYSFKTNINFLKIQNIYSKQTSFFLKSRIFIERFINFVLNDVYSLKKSIHFLKRGRIGQGYFIVLS